MVKTSGRGKYINMGDYNSFLLRIWSNGRTDEIKGFIQHVSTQESMNFVNWEKMINFINAHLESRSMPESQLEAELSVNKSATAKK
jgi:hypothetical protein